MTTEEMTIEETTAREMTVRRIKLRWKSFDASHLNIVERPFPALHRKRKQLLPQDFHLEGFRPEAFHPEASHSGLPS
jgi:hypothetical protein